MNRRHIFLLMMLLGVLMNIQDAEARGGGGRGGGGGGRGGGGGGGRGGYSGGGRSVSRAPTMSRADNRADRSSFQPRQMSGGDFQSRSKAQVQQFMNDGRSNFGDRNLGSANRNLGSANRNLGSADRNLGNLRNDVGNRQNFANNVRGDWNRGDWNRDNLFNNNFWRDHNYNPAYGNFWRGAAWGAAAGWLGYGWSSPYYYDDGYGIPVSSTGDTSYLYTQADQSTAVPEQSAPSGGQTASNWLPLGVYALKTAQGSSADATMYLQLALGKDGTLTGSYFNSATNQVNPVSGLVDKATQRAVWKMSDVDGAPIFDTGLFNLTKDNTTVNVTFSDGSVQQWFMVKATDGA